jgi:mRNA-degrading endonuclease toxin of MazEF toxin-antitoxin module
MSSARKPVRGAAALAARSVVVIRSLRAERRVPYASAVMPVSFGERATTYHVLAEILEVRQAWTG